MKIKLIIVCLGVMGIILARLFKSSSNEDNLDKATQPHLNAAAKERSTGGGDAIEKVNVTKNWHEEKSNASEFNSASEIEHLYEKLTQSERRRMTVVGELNIGRLSRLTFTIDAPSDKEIGQISSEIARLEGRVDINSEPIRAKLSVLKGMSNFGAAEFTGARYKKMVVNIEHLIDKNETKATYTLAEDISIVKTAEGLNGYKLTGATSHRSLSGEAAIQRFRHCFQVSEQ